MRFHSLSIAALALSLTLTASAAAGAANDAAIKRAEKEVSALYLKGNYQAALELAYQSLQTAEMKYGQDEPALVSLIAAIGVLHRMQGSLEVAEPFYLRALVLSKQSPKPNAMSVSEALSNLGDLYILQNRLQEARTTLQKALELAESAEGKEGKFLPTILNNLANTYSAPNEFAAAEALQQRGVAISEKVFGPQHENTAAGLHHLGLHYQIHGDYNKAAPLLTRALKIREKKLGPTHPDTAQNMVDLGINLAELRRDNEASPLLEKGIALLEQQLGEDYEGLAIPLATLARIERDNGMSLPATTKAKRSLQILEKRWGSTSAQRLLPLTILFRDSVERKDNEQVALYGQQLISFLDRDKQARPVDQVRVLSVIATAANRAKQWDRAKTHANRALAIVDQHPEIFFEEAGTILTLLGNLNTMDNKAEEAESQYLRALKLIAAREGELTPASIPALLGISADLIMLGKYADSKSYFDRAEHIRSQAPEPDFPNLMMDQFERALLLALHEQNADAEALMKAASLTLAKSAPLNDPIHIQRVAQLVPMLKELKREQEARALEQYLAKSKPDPS
ncbi:tetratricopeptide repeat protein [Chitinimonas naiadis]